MFVVLYRWRVKPGLERQFTANWTALTRHYLERCGSLGSRLHKGSDGLFYAYAQWPSSLARENASLDVGLEIALIQMREAIEESFSEVILDTVDDHLKLASN